jgi:hypothetical protein
MSLTVARRLIEHGKITLAGRYDGDEAAARREMLTLRKRRKGDRIEITISNGKWEMVHYDPVDIPE